MGACAKPNADKMVARKVDHDYQLGFRKNGADAIVVDEVDDEAEAFESNVFEETAIP